MKKVSTFFALLAIALIGVFATPIGATNENEGVCTGTHLSAGGASTFTYTAPEGFLVSAYCVKAGSINQGDGPEYHSVDPPASSITFSHSTGKDISHFSVTLIEDEEPPPPTRLLVGATFSEATCEAGPSFALVKTILAGLGPRPFYSIEGTLVDGKPVAGQSYTITALGVDGFTFGEQQIVWTHTFAAAPTNCDDPPPPPPPGDDPPGDNPPGGPQCPPGMTPTNGKDGEPGNDECEFPPSNPSPPGTPPVVTPPVTTPVVPPVLPPVTTPETTKKPPKKAATPVETPKKAAKPVTEEQLEKELVKQGGPKTTSAATPEASDTLPHTGLGLGWIASLGGLLSVLGVALRRRG